MSNVVSLAIGSSFVSALRRDGSRVRLETAQAAEQDIVGETLAPRGSALLRASGNLSANAPAGVVQFIGTNIGDRAIAAVAGGASNLVFLLADGRVAVSPPIGEISFPPDDLADAVAVRSGSAHGWAVRKNGDMVPIGQNRAGQLDRPRSTEPVSVVSAGGDQSLFHLGVLPPRVHGSSTASWLLVKGRSSMPTSPDPAR